LLSLGADQVIKINQNSAIGDGAVAVVASHLDYYCHPAQQKAIAECIAKITGNSNSTVVIT
jgi:hypothetical protein